MLSYWPVYYCPPILGLLSCYSYKCCPTDKYSAVLLFLHLLSSSSYYKCCLAVQYTYVCPVQSSILLSSWYVFQLSKFFCPSIPTSTVFLFLHTGYGMYVVTCHTVQYSAVLLLFLQLLSSNSYICCPTVQYSGIFLSLHLLLFKCWSFHLRQPLFIQANRLVFIFTHMWQQVLLCTFLLYSCWKLRNFAPFAWIYF